MAASGSPFQGIEQLRQLYFRWLCSLSIICNSLSTSAAHKDWKKKKSSSTKVVSWSGVLLVDLPNLVLHTFPAIPETNTFPANNKPRSAAVCSSITNPLAPTPMVQTLNDHSMQWNGLLHLGGSCAEEKQFSILWPEVFLEVGQHNWKAHIETD